MVFWQLAQLKIMKVEFQADDQAGCWRSLPGVTAVAADLITTLKVLPKPGRLLPGPTYDGILRLQYPVRGVLQFLLRDGVDIFWDDKHINRTANTV